MNPIMCTTKPNNLVEGINQLKINPEDIHFINRNIVDSKLPEYHDIGTKLLQLLPYVAIKCGNEYLTYNRKGSEDRLHGTCSGSNPCSGPNQCSMGFGGHVELQDVQDTVEHTIAITAVRELVEELGLKAPLVLTGDYIYSEYDNVSQVHLGVVGLVEIDDKSLIKPDELEIINPEWKTLNSIRGRLDSYEKWSQILAKHLDK